MKTLTSANGADLGERWKLKRNPTNGT
jgi:hypothetical protein